MVMTELRHNNETVSNRPSANTLLTYYTQTVYCTPSYCH